MDDEFDEGDFLSPWDDPDDGDENSEEEGDNSEDDEWQDNPFDGPATPDY